MKNFQVWKGIDAARLHGFMHRTDQQQQNLAWQCITHLDNLKTANAQALCIVLGVWTLGLCYLESICASPVHMISSLHMLWLGSLQ